MATAKATGFYCLFPCGCKMVISSIDQAVGWKWCHRHYPELPWDEDLPWDQESKLEEK